MIKNICGVLPNIKLSTTYQTIDIDIIYKPIAGDNMKEQVDKIMTAVENETPEVKALRWKIALAVVSPLIALTAIKATGLIIGLIKK